ncbi:TetR/AcrR family transcriptional regulator [Clostridium botulinum]|uniref:Transcriptional regulator n=1 Tax=Clostridium botulinum (strain Okra / Type B1) TaxID=498213 RepID=B1IEN6_CLOBK|nr:TetR/AcrR family transcriptional regulator [Clostridium botulinum]EKX80697.1 transcriptional regulator [Clostridium botulinum CFSAN001628]ACA46906.1 transcriptional regulator [Clostridium botulinum B1 str. Okra]MBD5561571.1 TetR/AcrR family transcriptional regulator [Clostridium botulinum]MBD5565240.1 TetR/AcrR family transcriptional regulator [Clostridium botulinum]MBD5570757.1 TetR/AcrR family transcriptional regulator [Clostridium botulinum]
MTNDTEKIKQAQKILDAAFKCISTRGYANVSLRDIADEADVVLSQLNYYYKNKEGLFTEIVKTLSAQYLNEIESNLKKGESGKERVACLIEYFQGVLRTKPELFTLIFDLSSMALWSEPLKKLLNDLFNDLTDLIEKYITNDFLDREFFKYESSATLARLMLGALFGTSIQVMLANGKADMIDSLSALKVLFEYDSSNQ